MLWKSLVGVLATVALAEGAFIVFGRQSINRFRAADVGGYMAFDTATGQLCRAIRMKATSKGVQYSPSADHTPESHLGNPPEGQPSKGYDRILDAIRNSPSNTEAAENYRLELILDLPACADIR